MGVTPTRGHSVAVNWTLTAPASAEVVVESLTGRRVRTVAAALAAPAGQNQATWDGRDDDGRPVPAGAYRCRVLVTTDDGQRAVAERMVVVGR
jgi:flagellar hook assembly protein FlgD